MKTRWQDQAACKGRDVDLFHPYDQEDFPDLPGQTIATFTKAKLEYAVRQYCTGCLVRDECNQDAIDHGLHTQGVWGGISPYGRGAKVGSIATASIDIHRDAIYESAVRAFVEGRSIPEVRRRLGLDPTKDNLPKVIQDFTRGFERKPLTASWDAYALHTVVSGRAVSNKAGAGWVLSVDSTRSTALVLASGPRHYRMWHPVKILTLSDELDTKSLPLLQEWPEAYDCI